MIIVQVTGSKAENRDQLSQYLYDVLSKKTDVTLKAASGPTDQLLITSWPKGEESIQEAAERGFRS